MTSKPSSTLLADSKKECEVLLRISGYNDALGELLGAITNVVAFEPMTTELQGRIAKVFLDAMKESRKIYSFLDDVLEGKHEIREYSFRFNFILIVNGTPVERQISVGNVHADF